MISILSEPDKLLATPTRCGSERLRGTLIRRLKVAIQLPHDHGWKKYEQARKRILIVREPLERWASTYHLLKSNDHSHGFGYVVKDRMGSFSSFAKLLTEEKSRAYIFQPLWKWVENFEPTRIQPVEDIIDDWDKILNPEWLTTYLETSPHASKNRKTVDELVKKVPRAFIEFIERDYDVLDYPKTNLNKLK